jgi:predicted enzyme related to lactoylglutathione lyase
MTESRPSRVVWCEIPSSNLDRAIAFYANILDTPLIKREIFGSNPIAVFPYEYPAISGCLVESTDARPTCDGVLVYLNCDGKLDEVLARVAAAGGAIAEPKTALPPGMGFGAKIVDSEGNRVGLHAAY